MTANQNALRAALYMQMLLGFILACFAAATLADPALEPLPHNSQRDIVFHAVMGFLLIFIPICGVAFLCLKELQLFIHEDANLGFNTLNAGLMLLLIVPLPLAAVQAFFIHRIKHEQAHLDHMPH
ncbi:hypothetical protein [Shewanella sp. YIC-542]|uniref:hypothetical protein n=1 Tax=Shewanella mytili TaxID=3377111 RepID=UPI00398ED0E9